MFFKILCRSWCVVVIICLSGCCGVARGGHAKDMDSTYMIANRFEWYFTSSVFRASWASLLAIPRGDHGWRFTARCKFRKICDHQIIFDVTQKLEKFHKISKKIKMFGNIIIECGKALRVIPRGKQWLTVYRASQVFSSHKIWKKIKKIQGIVIRINAFVAWAWCRCLLQVIVVHNTWLVQTSNTILIVVRWANRGSWKVRTMYAGTITFWVFFEDG